MPLKEEVEDHAIVKDPKELVASKPSALILSVGGRLECGLILDDLTELFSSCVGVILLLR